MKHRNILNALDEALGVMLVMLTAVSIIICCVGMIWAIVVGDRNDPYSEGMHWGYHVRCENGYAYKVIDERQGVIQILNSDGTPLRCGQTIY